MKKTIIVDSGVIVEYLKTGKGVLPTAYEKYNMVISMSTYIELLASKTFSDKSLKQEVKEFIDKYFSLVDVNREVADMTSEILRNHSVTLAVGIIAATSIVNKFELLTSDTQEFARIDGLSLLKIEE